MKEFIKKILPSFLVNWYHFLLALLGVILYRNPSGKIRVIGVTGTNGKTTVVRLTTEILEGAGYKVASLSSINFKIGKKEWKNFLKMTMPGRLFIQRFLRRAVNNNCQYAVLEVTSEGIKQHRHRFIRFEEVVFTNLTPEHIESHGGFENYRREKGKIFKICKNIHVVNIDDENAGYFLQFFAKRKYLYQFNKQDKKCRIIVQYNGEIKDIKEFSFSFNLPGEFNIYNALAAICVGLSQGIDLEDCVESVKRIKGIPGRMEEVVSFPFRVFVDYAFTPNALAQVYQVLKPKGHRMICVLGACGGGRDKWKRPVLGRIASKYCDEIILTNEDPYDEDPVNIIEDVARGIEKKVKRILDRRVAIKTALSLARENDVVIITGKGCEPWICVSQGKKIAWDDREVVREEFKKLNDSNV